MNSEFDFVEEEVSATIHINIYENKDERLSLSIKFSVIFPFDVISNFVGMLRRWSFFTLITTTFTDQNKRLYIFDLSQFEFQAIKQLSEQHRFQNLNFNFIFEIKLKLRITDQ